MRVNTLLTYTSALLGAVSAAPKPIARRQAAGAQNVVYWGQNGGGTIENNDLSTYCQPNSGIDVIVLAFLYSYGNGQLIPSGTVGQSCFIAQSGQGQNCEALSAAIATCKANGVKIILSLGGAVGSYTLSSNSEAETIAQNLWNAYGNSGNTGVQRPFGNNFVNGFDFDLEANRGAAYYPAMIAKLRSLFATDPSNTYYITGAPQCPIPEPNMGTIIGNATFDYLFVQFYNNADYTYPCALPFNNLNAPFNYDQWVSFTASSASANAKIFIGVPASPLGATGTPSGEKYYITPDQLSSLVSEYKSHTRFGGIMMWSAGFSDANVNNGCTYAQEAHAILVTGSTCVNGPVSGGGGGGGGSSTTTTRTATSTATTTSTSATATATGTVPQWGQCGGIGYTGPTQCIPPYTCVYTSDWWAQCE
ncbi:putative endochitinase CHI2 [Thozetella sp. PMI_491]|nr:putative endochitinase CHI2 [Thozetella sp. PMI_491]